MREKPGSRTPEDVLSIATRASTLNRQFAQSAKEQIDFRPPQREWRQQPQHRWVIRQPGYDSSLEQCFLHRPCSDAFECKAQKVTEPPHFGDNGNPPEFSFQVFEAVPDIV